MSAKISAVVIGLGQVGSRFDADPLRRTVWSHVGAYLDRRDDFELSGACDPDPERRAEFAKRCPAVPVFSSLEELLECTSPQVASVCTPVDSHAKVVDSLLEVPDLRVIWCEKPLADSVMAARQMVAACESRQVVLMVSHTRRWLPLWRRVRELIVAGAVGDVRCVRVAMPNRIVSIGSHTVDLAIMLGGNVLELRGLEIPNLYEDQEQAIAGLLRFESGALGIVQITGRKAKLIVEAEIVGEDGRISAREDTGILSLERFGDSTEYENYQKLGESETEHYATASDFSPFVAIAEEIAALARDPGGPATCSGVSALETQRILERLIAAANAEPSVMEMTS